MRHAVTVDGDDKTLDVRAMDADCIIHWKLEQAPTKPADMEQPQPGESAHAVRQFFVKQVEKNGSCMILAWEGDVVVGQMHFTTREIHKTLGGPENYEAGSCYCVDHEGFGPKLSEFNDEGIEHLLESESRVLRILCFNVGHTDPRWHGKGIAKAMVEYLKQWAREREWRRIEARSCPDIIPTSIVGDWMLRRGTYERLGFHVKQEHKVTPEESENRLWEIERLSAPNPDYPPWVKYYVTQLPRLLIDPDWKTEYDKNYLMACDLQ